MTPLITIAAPAGTGSGAQTAGSGPSPLHKAASEFEGMMINTLWSGFQDDPMTQDDDADADAGGSTIRGMGLQAMSKAMSESGGLGIANMIEKQLGPMASRQAGQASAAKAYSQNSFLTKAGGE